MQNLTHADACQDKTDQFARVTVSGSEEEVESILSKIRALGHRTAGNVQRFPSLEFLKVPTLKRDKPAWSQKQEPGCRGTLRCKECAGSAAARLDAREDACPLGHMFCA